LKYNLFYFLKSIKKYINLNLISIPFEMTNSEQLPKLTWAEMAAIDDEEEEMLREEQYNQYIKYITEYRRFLFSIGEYELEEGEILE
jgi:hypothetical protein